MSSYKDSGVDIDAGNKLIEKIKPFAKATSRVGANSDLGGFGGLFDLAKCGYKDPILVSATDGVGTKLKIAIESQIHDTIGIDLVAMSVNDLVVQGAEPLFFLDYFSCSKLNSETAAKVIKGISDGCKQSGCALIGGETAEMPGIYQEKDYDLAGFAVGAVEREQILPKNVAKNDLIIGLESSGVHSNGFSLVRYILENNQISLNDKFDQNSTFAQNLLTPTKIYVRQCLEALKTKKVKALCHITGGGLVENLPRVFSKDLQAKIDYNSWKMPEIFKFLQQKGDVNDHEMHKTFNCGIGMTLITSKNDSDEVMKALQQSGENPIIIGEITNS